MLKKYLALPLILACCFCNNFPSAALNAAGDMETRTFGSVTFLKAPYLIYTNDSTTMKVMWQTTGTTVSTIEWGKTNGYGSKAIVSESGSGSYQHQFGYMITGLSPALRIYYKVTAGSVSSEGSFQTAPAASVSNLSFYVYGDNRDGVNERENVMYQLLDDMDQDSDHRQTFCMHVGDMACYGEDEDFWINFFPDVTDPGEIDFPSTLRVLSSLPHLVALGNHDCGSIEKIVPTYPGDLVRKYWPLDYYALSNHSYYSFDYGPLHVTVLDQYADSGAYTTQGSAQYNWMVKDLSGTTKPWKIVIFHEPAWTASRKTGFSGNNLDIQKVLCPVFKANGVKLVLQGHQHYYARCNPPDGLIYLTVGTSGAKLFPPDTLAPSLSVSVKAYHFARFDISGNNMKVTVKDDKGNVIDKFKIALSK